MHWINGFARRISLWSCAWVLSLLAGAAQAAEPLDYQIELQKCYAEGLIAYRERRWDDARAAFTAALAAVPQDGPTRTMLKRLDMFAAAPPAENWDGAWHLDQK